MSFDEDAERRQPGGPPLPPDDRLWRHPSELGGPPRPPGPPLSGPPQPLARPSRATWGLVIASAACGAVIAAGALLAIGADRDPGADDVREWLVPAAEPREPAEIAEDVLPSVVRLEVAGAEGAVVGSGLIFRDDGHVLTSADLLEGAGGVVAVLHSGESVEASVVGVDPTTDVGVVKLDVPSLPGAPLGSVAGLQSGEATISIGSSPAPGHGPVVTRTVVSEVGARLVDQTERPLYGMLRLNTTAGVSPAGSIVVDQSGAVIGLTTPRQPVGGLTTTSMTTASVATSGPATRGFDTFATPVEYARKIADDLISTGRAQHVWLGVEQTDSEMIGTGARIYQVAPDSPASAAGLLADDVMMTVGGRRVHSMSEVIVSLRDHRPGETLEIEYRRKGKARTCTATLGVAAE